MILTLKIIPKYPEKRYYFFPAFSGAAAGFLRCFGMIKTRGDEPQVYEIPGKFG